MKKKSIILNLSEREINVLDELSEKKGMSKTSILKHALALYQIIQLRIEDGEKIFTEDEKKDRKELLLV